MPQTNQEQKPTLEIRLESMKKIDDRVNQWMIMEEHWATNNLNRRQQVDLAQQLFTEIKAEIAQAYHTCPSYCDA
jgi:hypothetical protein